MERFGYIVADSCSGEDYLYIHNKLYDNILECVENARLHKTSVQPAKIMYFSILSNAEIVQFLHETQTEEKRFGFCQLTKYTSAEKYSVYSSHKLLFETIVETITMAKGVSWNDVPDCPNFEAKLGYFQLLNDDEVLKSSERSRKNVETSEIILHNYPSPRTMSLSILENASKKRKQDISPIDKILETASKKRKHDVSSIDKNSADLKKSKKNFSKTDSESDVESIISDDERNSIISAKSKKNPKQWNETYPTTSEYTDQYDVHITNDFKKTDEDIPPLSVYIAVGFAVEIKKFRKTFYLTLSKKDSDTQRKKFINIPSYQLTNVQEGLRILQKHIKKHSKQ
ncbi:uncharacterized protein TNCT_579351 [Trichonephila clavata]|uniref:Uncharacterized protein n=1 Tax=Trichonephila clavata TaxID=2740835 RepID=A0A8X6IYH1_TRICU|nr:uncharacterized protein TNCT_579351 [Trichonephila clavata]